MIGLDELIIYLFFVDNWLFVSYNRDQKEYPLPLHAKRSFNLQIEGFINYLIIEFIKYLVVGILVDFHVLLNYMACAIEAK